MSEVTNPQPPQHFLELVKRLYEKRDQILISTNKLVDYTSKLSECEDNKLTPLLSEMWKEINSIISYVHELAPHLKNPGIVDHISKQAKLLSLQLEQTTISPVLNRTVAMLVRTSICQEANKTQLRPTPKSIKKAFGITVSPRDIKLAFEHQQDNY